MKKYISIFMLVAAAVLGTACSNDNNELPEYAVGLNVVKAQTAFNVVGGTNEVKMASEPAQAYAQDAWLTVTKKAETLLLTAATNTSPQTRNTLLVIKNVQGDSITLNVQQEGITFGLPAGEDIFTDDKAVQKTLIATANVPVTYVTTGDWISVEQKGNEVGVKVTENTTGKARVGWVIAKAVGLVDSLKVVQASLADFVGEYKQTAKMRNADRTLSERTSDVRIEAATGTNKANFIVDNKYTWSVDFIPGKGFKMTNGKVVAKNEVQTGVYEYLISVIVADDFSKEHETAINGTQESILLAIDDAGNLVFKEAQKLASEQTFSSYGWNRFSDSKPVMGAYRGIGEVYVQPRITRK
jgi:hypothetical protein